MHPGITQLASTRQPAAFRRKIHLSTQTATIA
jgi:hypothetical protein